MKHRNVSLFVPHEGCPHACTFCNQKVISGQNKGLTAEEIRIACLTALQSEGYLPEHSEIAFFGGSFTAIPTEKQHFYLETVQEFIGDGKFGGIRISTRPDCINEEILAILKEYNVKNVELGAQSMSDDVLTANHRGHTAEDTENAVRLLRKYGFGVGLQMMTGLYKSTPETDLFTATEFVRLQPDTVRIYPTAVLEHTVLADLYKKGEYRPQALDEAVALCAELLTMFYDNNIRVIRTGLHAGGDVQGNLLAGVFHPAFGELCEGEIYYNAMCKALDGKPQGNYTVFVHPKEYSKAVGQKRNNLIRLSSQGYTCRVKADVNIEKYHVLIHGETEENECI